MIAASHAGGVAYRRRESAIEFLLVRSKDRTCRVLPKGHIEPGEDAAGAAAREVLEETGYVLAPGPCLGTFTYAARVGTVRTVYFLMEASLETRPGYLEERFRDPQWYAIDEARRADLPVPDGVLDLLELAQRTLST